MSTIKEGVYLGLAHRGERVRLVQDDSGAAHIEWEGGESHAIAPEHVDKVLANLHTPSPKFHYGVLREPAFAEAETFADLFAAGGGSYTRGELNFSDYVYQREPFKSWQLHLTAQAAQHLQGEMLAITNDRIHFEIIRVDNGRAVVFAEYGIILGSRYLAEIDASSILQ